MRGRDALLLDIEIFRRCTRFKGLKDARQNPIYMVSLVYAYTYHIVNKRKQECKQYFRSVIH